MAETAPPKKLVILGSTGSIGVSSLKVARELPGRMKVVGLAANRSSGELGEQIVEFGVKHACLFDDSKYAELQEQVSADVSRICERRQQSRVKAEAHRDLARPAILDHVVEQGH